MKYLVKLVNGETFTGERHWWFCFFEGWRWWSFSHVIGKDMPTTGKKRLHIPESSILWKVELGKGRSGMKK